jgi:hypothetical protein
MSDRGIGDNGGPKIEKFTAKNKIDRIREVLDMDITAHQKCVGVGIIVEADSDGIAAELSTKRLQTFASVSDRETVYRATRVLEDKDVTKAIKVKGKPNSYRILPSNVVDAIVEAYNQSKSSRVEPDKGSPVKPDNHVGSNQTAPDNEAVGSHPTTPSNQVGSNPTGRVLADEPSRARIEPPSGVNIPLDNNKLASSAREEAPELAGLNGSADLMLADIMRWMSGGDEKSARAWLAKTIHLYGNEVVRDSYQKLGTDILTGKPIAQPLQTWSKIAMRMRDEPKGAAPEATPKESTRESIRRYAEEAEARVRQRVRGRQA